VKWIKTECARIILGSLQLGLHVIGSPWRHAANHGALLVVSMCACQEKTLSLWRTPFRSMQSFPWNTCQNQT
jgi:hypothetical protein